MSKMFYGFEYHYDPLLAKIRSSPSVRICPFRSLDDLIYWIDRDPFDHVRNTGRLSSNDAASLQGLEGIDLMKELSFKEFILVIRTIEGWSYDLTVFKERLDGDFFSGHVCISARNMIGCTHLKIDFENDECEFNIKDIEETFKYFNFYGNRATCYEVEDGVIPKDCYEELEFREAARYLFEKNWKKEIFPILKREIYR